MTNSILWLHDKALSRKALETLNEQTRAIFIWDEEYFKSRSYSLKRLVFIYETLCEMPLEIIKGDPVEVMDALAPDKIQTLATQDSKIRETISQLSANHTVEVIQPAAFAQVPTDLEFRRFFKYWNKAKKTAFLKDGGHYS